ncbi:MAG: hypothetical protein ACRD8Z_25650 [Nitrososphaeraceae archaeon]
MDYRELINTTRDLQLRDIPSNEKALIYRIINSDGSTYRIASSKFRFRQQNYQERNDYALLKGLVGLRYVEENQEQRKILGGSMIYRFTTHGLLYIFANKLIYPPQLLLNYSLSSVLKTLVFPYFETKTISQGTARFYEAITEYLNECAIILTIQDFPLKSESESHDRRGDLLGYELGELIKVLAVKLALMYSESNLLTISSALVENDSARVSLYELESSMKGLLASDRKFMHFLEKTKNELDEIR